MGACSEMKARARRTTRGAPARLRGQLPKRATQSCARSRQCKTCKPRQCGPTTYQEQDRQLRIGSDGNETDRQTHRDAQTYCCTKQWTTGGLPGIRPENCNADSGQHDCGRDPGRPMFPFAQKHLGQQHSKDRHGGNAE